MKKIPRLQIWDNKCGFFCYIEKKVFCVFSVELPQ